MALNLSDVLSLISGGIAKLTPAEPGQNAKLDLNPSTGGSKSEINFYEDDETTLIGTIKGETSVGVDISSQSDLFLQGLQWPNLDGSNTQILTTNGANVLSWSNKGDISSINLGNSVTIDSGSLDPSVSGFTASVGSTYLSTNGYTYKKVGLTDTDWESTITSNVSVLDLLDANKLKSKDVSIVEVKKNPTNGEFSSIQAAIDSITDASPSKVYQVSVGPGYYFENTVKMKPYVNITGHSQTAVILPSINGTSVTNNKNIVEGSPHSALFDVTLAGATTTSATQTTGPLVTGKTYEITNYVTGDDFTNVGAPRNENGVVFTATGTTPTTYSNGTELTLNAYGLFYENSTLTATSSLNVGNVRIISCNKLGRINGQSSPSNCTASNIYFGGSSSFLSGFEVYGGYKALLSIKSVSTISNTMTAPLPTTVFKISGADAELHISSVEISTGDAGIGGTFAEISNGGVYRSNATIIDGFTTGIHLIDSGAPASAYIAGTTFANCATNINAEANSMGFFTGFSPREKNNIDLDSLFFITNKDSNIITVAKAGGDYTSIKTALESITDASFYNGYVVSVGPGIFVEDSFTTVPYVTILGSGLLTTIISSSNPDGTFIEATSFATFRDVNITGATGINGVGIHYSGDASDGAFTITDSAIGANKTCLKVDNVQTGHTATILATDVVMGGPGIEFDIGYDIDSHLGGAAMVLNSCKSQNITGILPTNFMRATGPGCNILINSTVAYSTGSTGSALDFSNGVQAQVNNSYLTGWHCGIELNQPVHTPVEGYLIPGVLYRIDSYTAGDDFSNIGGPGVGISGEHDGVTFIATEFPPTSGAAIPTQWFGSSLFGGFSNSLISSGVTINDSLEKSLCVYDLTATGSFTGNIPTIDAFYINEACSFYITGRDIKLVKVAKKGGDFSSIEEAVDFLYGKSSDTDRYVIQVGPGIFYEREIDLTPTPYVSVVGANIQTTVVRPLTPTQNVFKLGLGNEISFLNIQDASSPGYAAIRCHDSGDFSQAHKISITNCYYGVLLTTDTVDSVFYGEYIDFDGDYNHAVKCISGVDIDLNPTAGTAMTLANFDDCYTFVDNGVVATTVRSQGPNCSVNWFGGKATGNLEPGSRFLHIFDGAFFSASALEILDTDTAIFNPNLGTAARIDLTGVRLFGNNTDINIEHPTTTILFSGVASHERISIEPTNPNTAFTYLDSEDSKFELSRAISVLQSQGTHTEILQLTTNQGVGLISGGVLTDEGSRVVSITDLVGYYINSLGEIAKAELTAIPDLTIPANSVHYVYVDSDGNVVSNPVEPSAINSILLGRISTNGSEIRFIDAHKKYLNNASIDYSSIAKDIFGTMFVSGSIVSAGTSGTKISVSSGKYYVASSLFFPSGGTDITFDVYYRDGSGGWTVVANQTSVPNGFYDNNSGTLAALSSGGFVKHLLYVVGQGVDEKYFLVYGQEAFTSAQHSNALSAALPISPSYFEEGVVKICSIIAEEGAGLSDFISERPLATTQASQTTSITDHNDLTGLTTGNSGHTQFMMLNGTTPMSSNLDMGAFSIINVGNVDGIDVSAHASRHNFGGTDGFTKGTPSELTDSTNVQGTDNSAFAAGNHTHAHGNRGGGTLHSTVIASGAAGFMSGTDKAKLDGIANGATENSTDVFLLSRSNHIGTQLASTISNFSTAAQTAVTSVTGNAGTATVLQTARTINGVSFDGSANITVTAAAGTLTGTTLNSTVVTSSLTSVGTLTNLTVTNPISGSVTGSSGSTTGNAATATALQTARTINGTAFDGTANITVTAAAGTLTGTSLNTNIVTSSLTSVGTLLNLTVTNPISGSVTGSSGSTTGNAATATALQTARTINGTSFDGTANITVTAAAGTLTGTTLNSSVVTSSLTSVGTLTNLTVTNPISGSVTGSAASFTGSLSGDVTGTQGATAISATTVTGKVLTGYTSGAGTVAATDTILQAIQKLNGNTSLKLNIAPRLQSVTSSATVTPASDTEDMVVITAQAAGLTLANPSGTPAQGQKLTVRLKDNGGAQTISFGTQYRAMGNTLPTTTVASKTMYMGFIYNSTDTKWDLVALAQEA